MKPFTSFVVFDLDDTLYKEVDYLISAYEEIAFFLQNIVQVDYTTLFDEMVYWYTHKANAFQNILDKYDPSGIYMGDLLHMYRNHIPNIRLEESVKFTLETLKNLNIPIAIMTDGRSIQQRNKIGILGLEEYTDDILISEEFGSGKPDVSNYEYFMKLNPGHQYFYIGDNTKKDFVSANELGWVTICLLDDGRNIHKQDFSLREMFLPQHKIEDLKDCLPFISPGLPKDE